MTPLHKFQQLLRELFEFDCADLDFGVYRILNYKRAVLQQFIEQDLPRLVQESLHKGAIEQMQQAQQRLNDARQELIQTLGKDALDPQGNLLNYHDTPVGQKYLEARRQAQGARPAEALETDLYNHLYAFFSRYWQDGDFISKRRYGHKQRYAIPYNGEEVYLYWANHDQYYIKTAEYLADYAYKAPNGVSVQFKLQNAHLEHNNVKGEKRFFIPKREGVEWNPDTRTIVIPFEFRPLTSEEANRYNDQQAILTAAESELLQQVSDPDAQAALAAPRAAANGETISLLMHHLRRYTKRQTSDFFIHKDLRGFLTRELDFYLKNEVLRLDDLLQAGETLAPVWLQLLQLIRQIGGHIIEFLAQFEEFQKALWEKKKFITETFYVITVGNVPEAFYPEIARNEAQWQEWRTMLHTDENEPNLLNADATTEERRIQYLQDHPTLPLDTRHFPQEFTDRLLASYENLDDLTDGLLIHSENWQALNLLQEKYRERIKCIYIDPPYNTGNDEFIYRDSYQHSSWICMMKDRMNRAKELMLQESAIFVSIDDNEVHNLRHIMDSVFGSENFEFIIEWQARKSVSSDALLSYSHNHILLYAKNKVILDSQRANWRLPLTEGRESEFSNPDNDPLGPWKLEPFDAPNVRPNLTYPITNPITGKTHMPPSGRCWRTTEEEFQKLFSEGRILFGKTGRGRPAFKRYLSEIEEKGQVATTWWSDIETTTDGTRLLQEFMGDKSFNNPKPIGLIQRIAQLAAGADDFFLDYFAGSGTTGHAVINLNRADGGRRKFILVEMAGYFDTVLLPRLKKVTFTPEWREGKPARMATPEEAQRSPRILKAIRLESYEDALNNLAFDEEAGAAMRDALGEEYLLRYMLHWESRESPTMLNLEQLRAPFEYQLTLHRDGETRARTIDLPETFNYLLGLTVERRLVYDDSGRRYLVYRGVQRDGTRTAVIWRDLKGWTQTDYEHDRAFIETRILSDLPVDVAYVNGDSCAERAQSLDALFKERMFTGASR